MPTPRKPTAGFWIVVVVIVLPILYGASFGPACWAVTGGYVSRSVLAAIYEPLISVAVNPLSGETNVLWHALYRKATVCGGQDAALSVMLFV